MPLNAGVLEVAYVTLDVTALSNAGHHVWDPASNTSLSNPKNVQVTGQEDPTYVIEWDSVNGDRFHVVAAADGSDVTADTDIGEVTLRVEGRR